MKWKLLLCGAALVVTVTGCAFSHNEYSSYSEFGYTYDLVPPPVMGLTPDEAVRIMQAPPISAAQSPSPALPYGDVVRPTSKSGI
ncbi:MAG TPA: hypothetical protein VFC44_18960 [Candidatus Saccharimonadales bacterium]|nr:hypothetical protein [Candidatus Saccharimonadales bacterium]